MAAATCRKILVVEDEGLIAHDIAHRLEALGHQVVGVASTAEEALEQAPQADLVLMDIRIDGPRDGIEAAQEIRARHHVPVVFLTSHADRDTLDRAKTAEPFGYIVKPLGPSSLQTAIEMAAYKHRLDRQLEEREAWLRTTIASAADAFIAAETSGRVRLLNPAAERLTGWRLGEAAGQPLETVLRLVEETGDDFGDPAPLAILRGAPVELPRGLRVVARGGRESEVEGAAAPVIAGAETLGVVITLRDVSLRRFEERQLRQAQRMETAGRLAARVSAGYALLIETIRNQADMLLRQLGGYGPARQGLEEIQRAAMAAAQATRRLAEFGTRQITHPEPLSVNAVLRRMAKLVESAAGPTISTAIRSTPEVGRVRADSAQIEQAVLNLVLYACQAISERGGERPGRLLLETYRAEAPRQGRLASFVALSVSYSAPEPDLDRLFDPAGPDEEALALSMAHSIATENGGYLVASPTPEGTRLDLYLPRLAEELPAGQTARTPGAPSILLVDYRDRVREQLHNFFEAAGYNLIEAATREEAVALGHVHEGSLDLLVADAADAAAIHPGLAVTQPHLRILEIVDADPAGPHQIRRPFTQQALLDRVESLLGQPLAV
jgi:two-component system cell cycle sensor histidine kinase/response regulator CckA